MTEFEANVALVFALPEERSYFHKYLENRPGWKVTPEKNRFNCYYELSDTKITVTVQTLERMGHIESVLTTSSLIDAATPDLALMIGIAGSLDPSKVGLADVVVSNQIKFLGTDKVASVGQGNYAFDDMTKSDIDGKIVVDHRDKFMSNSFLRYERNFVECDTTDKIIADAYGKMGDAKLEPLPKTVKSVVIEGHDSQRERKTHFGWILGGHNVVDSKEYRDYLLEKNTNLKLDIHHQKGDHDRSAWKSGDVLAVDMESYGFLKAAEKIRKTPVDEGGSMHLYGAFVVRGISDLCEEKSSLDSSTGNEVRKLATVNATKVAIDLIEKTDFKAISKTRYFGA